MITENLARVSNTYLSRGTSMQNTECWIGARSMGPTSVRYLSKRMADHHVSQVYQLCMCTVDLGGHLHGQGFASFLHNLKKGWLDG